MNLWRLDMCQTGLAPCSHWEQRVTIITEFHHIHSPWPPVTECHFHSSWRLSQKWWGGDSNTALVGRRHGLLTIGAIQFQPLWWHWREDQRCRWRDVLHAGGKRSRGVLKVRGTPEYLLLRGFSFTFSYLNVFPYPLWQWREVWGRKGTWRIREGSFLCNWRSWNSLLTLDTG